MSHDQNFKNLILDYPLQSLDFFAAEEAGSRLAGAEVIPVRQEQLQERLGERFRELDVPLLAQWPDGRREALLFVIEEESNPRRFSIHRLARYCLDLGELFETDRVVPVVIFLCGGPRRRELELGGDRHTYLSFRFLSCELAAIPYEQHLDSDNVVARITLPAMHCAAHQRLDAYIHAVRGLTSLESDPEKQLKYFDFIDTYANLDDNERASVARAYPDEVNIMGSFAERYIQQGREEGEQQGEAKILLRLLQLKFGDIPEAVRSRIEGADTQTLLAWSERVLTAASIEQVIAD
jgi:hypothetical protein